VFLIAQYNKSTSCSVKKGLVRDMRGEKILPRKKQPLSRGGVIFPAPKGHMGRICGKGKEDKRKKELCEKKDSGENVRLRKRWTRSSSPGKVPQQRPLGRGPQSDRRDISEKGGGGSTRGRRTFAAARVEGGSSPLPGFLLPTHLHFTGERLGKYAVGKKRRELFSPRKGRSGSW